MSVTSPVTGRVTGIVASGVTRSIGHRTRVAFDADALTYITAVEAADDDALESSIKVAYNNFVKGCKADGIWTAIKASCILAGAKTLTGCLVPLVGTAPTNVGPFVTGDYNRVTGLKGNGSTKYLNTNRNNNADPQNSYHQSVWVSESPAPGAGGAYIGAGAAGTGASQITAITAAPHEIVFRNQNGETAHSHSKTIASLGIVGSSRSGSSNFIGRADGVNETGTIVSQTPHNGNILVFARNSATNEAGLFNDCRMSFYSIGESLNLANLDTRVTRLLCEIEFGINTGLAGTGYDLDTLKYVNAGYAAGGTLA